MDSHLLVVIGGAVLAGFVQGLSGCVLAGRAFDPDMGRRSAARGADGDLGVIGRTVLGLPFVSGVALTSSSIGAVFR